MTPGQASPDSSDQPLVEGKMVRCPNCLRLRNSRNPHELRMLDRPKRFEGELNPVYKCMKTTGGCSHCFSPKDLEDPAPTQVNSNGGKH